MGLLNRLFGTNARGSSGRRAAPSVDPGAPPTARRQDSAGSDPVRRGLAYHQSGDLKAAESAYREGLATDPDRPDAHYLLGSLLGQSGRLDESLEHLCNAARLDPEVAEPHADMGNVYRLLGRLDDAEAAYRSAIRIDARDALVHRNLADLLRHQGRTDEAIACLADAASVAADDADTHFILADLLAGAGRYQEAERSYRTGLEIAPMVAAAHNNLGATLRHLDRGEEAAECFVEALRLDPRLADAHCNLAELAQARARNEEALEHLRAAAEMQPDGVPARRRLGQLLMDVGRSEEAVRWLREALTLEPEEARSHSELGNALIAAGQLEEGIERMMLAIERDPRDPSTHVNLGFALNESKRFEEARHCFYEALALDPEVVEAYNNLGGVLQLQGELVPAMQAYERAMQLAPDQLYVRSNYLTCLNYHEDADPVSVFEQHCSYSDRLAAMPPTTRGLRIADPEPERRLRIGYVSADFRYHSVAFFIAPILAEHDRKRFEVTCYANVTTPDANTERLKSLCDRWRDIGNLGDAEVAAWIRRDEIDILVDLSGHTVGNRLPVFAGRAAPVQVTYLGYPNTSGLREMDYRIVDAVTDPPGSTEALHSEELVRIEGGFLCFEPMDTSPEVRAPRTPDSSRAVTFASFNELLKVTPGTVAAWCEILERTPGSRLIIKGTTLEDEGTRDRVRARFVERGLAPDRLELVGRTRTLEEHLAWYNKVDIALDTYPYNGTTTTCEALWMGVPVVSRRGRVHASRVGASLLMGLGLEDLVAGDPGAYVDTAVALAADHERRARLRTELRERMRASSLMDASAHTRRVETAYRDMWRRACEKVDDERTTGEGVDAAMTVNISEDIRVLVPADINDLTPFVLLEQEDWFEDEIRFARRLLEPGMRCLDIGSNYGVFSLSCARRVGPDGRVWSFEPTPETARFLEASIEANELENVELVRAALSRSSGTAKLVTHADSEHNYLTEHVSGDEAFEIVDVRSLDDLDRERGLAPVDFIKVDAEGAEIAILEGGEDLLRRESPVVLFEFKYREGANWALVDALAERAFDVYRLVPGMQILVPFDREDPDPFQLNLFAVRPGTAQALTARGLLVASPGEPAPRIDAPSIVEALGRRPYSADLVDEWRRTAADMPEGLADGLGWYCQAWDTSLSVAERFAALERGRSCLSRPLESGAEVARLYSLARVAWELGYRARANEALDALLARADAGDHVPVGAPFLCVSPRFDAIAPGGDLSRWCLAQLLEQRVRLGAFSSYFQDARILDTLEALSRLPHQSPEMERRRRLMLLRHGREAPPAPGPLLGERSEENLNPEFWRATSVVTGGG